MVEEPSVVEENYAETESSSLPVACELKEAVGVQVKPDVKTVRVQARPICFSVGKKL